LDPAGKKKEKRRATDHVPAVELGRAKNEDPLIRRRVALHDLIRDKRGERSGVEPGQQPDGLRDGRGVCGGIFTRTMQRVALKKENSQWINVEGGQKSLPKSKNKNKKEYLRTEGIAAAVRPKMDSLRTA
jgi:hypothetical protein